MFFILGASGSGKSAVSKILDLPQYTLIDFDNIGVPANADTPWRQSATEKWLSTILNNYDETLTCLFGQMVLGEILACPSASKISQINICFLDCNDQMRIQRLKNCSHSTMDQNLLNWASWLRIHHFNPQWEQQVIIEHHDTQLDFSVWDQETSWLNLATIYFCDTSHMAIPAVASEISRWVLSFNDSDDLHFCKAISSDLDSIISLIKNDQLAKSRETTSSDLLTYEIAFKKIINNPCAYLLIGKIKNRIVAVAQINFIANLTYQGGTRALIEGVRVDQQFRNQGIGKQLIKQAIDIAKARKCCLVQLTTDKQRPDALHFYESLGFVNSHHGLKLWLPGIKLLT